MRDIMRKVGILALAFTFVLCPMFMFTGCKKDDNKEDNHSSQVMTIDEAETKLKSIVATIPQFDSADAENTEKYSSLASFDAQLVMSSGEGAEVNVNGKTESQTHQFKNENGVLQAIITENNKVFGGVVVEDKMYLIEGEHDLQVNEATKAEYYEDLIKYSCLYTCNSVMDFYSWTNLIDLDNVSEGSSINNSERLSYSVEGDLYTLNYKVEGTVSYKDGEEVYANSALTFNISITFNSKAERIEKISCTELDTITYVLSGEYNGATVSAGDVKNSWSAYEFTFNFETPKFEIPQTVLDAINSVSVGA